MSVRGRTVAMLACVVLAGCAGSSEGSADAPFTLPVGPTTWDTSAPAWLLDGTLHVGDATVELGDDVDQFVLGATGVYWIRGGTLLFTSAEGVTHEVADVGWRNLAVSADRSVLATTDQSRGPTDRYGTHVMQVAAFDTRTGEQLYRTPDEKPDRGADLADLYGEIMPLLHGVSTKHVFFDGATIDLEDGSREDATLDADGLEVYPHLADTLFPEGYRVGITGEGRHRELSDSSLSGTGLLSPDRSAIFDTSAWPTKAVAHDAASGVQRAIGSPWEHFSLAGWSDADTFFGVAEQIDEDHVVNVVRARQVVTCELSTLRCEPVSPVVRTPDDGEPATLLVEGTSAL
ncbi:MULTISPECIES: hypothetical protein [unclassified Aeromicrobium]|uniref:hypothetical protein n=1 Tax=unclassified Aeromicrobium TaxID=2633570 RepID=UPI00396B266A